MQLSIASYAKTCLTGWCGEIRDVIFSDSGSVTVVYRVTVRGSDGEVWLTLNLTVYVTFKYALLFSSIRVNSDALEDIYYLYVEIFVLVFLVIQIWLMI